MKIFDWYVFKNLTIAMVFIACTLAVVVFLTQSLRFLELVIESGASSITFWILTFLALPRFFEIILPIALMAATIFIYNRMTMDSELVVARSSGYSPILLARPAIVLGIIVMVCLWIVTMWVAPKSLSNMQQMRQIIKAQFSNYLFREGVFNQAGKGLTLYIRERNSHGELHGLMIHDARDPEKTPVTILAKRGLVVEEDGGFQVLVYDGSRQQLNAKSATLDRLNFERYTIDLPNSSPVRKRWQEPDERTIIELLNPDNNNARDVENLHEFNIEIHRRLLGPALALVFVLIASATLLTGAINRRGQMRRIIFSIISLIVIQGLFLTSYNLARQGNIGLILMYFVVFIPGIASTLFLSVRGQKILGRIVHQGSRQEGVRI